MNKDGTDLLYEFPVVPHCLVCCGIKKIKTVFEQKRALFQELF